ncbi:hypothetical protein [Arthrobacter flavus]|uniref:HlyD family secretion protein n=1 Tax=Arthrobacter flavus TaxID=95172 RepID=A0ABW4Q582_9MICC
MLRSRRDRSAEQHAETAGLDLVLDDTGQEQEPIPTRSSVSAGVAAVFQRNKTLWIVVAAAALSLVIGLLLGRFLVSPADAAADAEPPTPGLVTVPVEYGQLSNDVTIRGEVAYADPVEVRIDTSSISGPAVVTGQVPEEGTDLEPLSIALEVAGRPVIVLPGELPAYRTLQVGVSGPDVVQFKTAVRTIGIDAGDPADPVFGVDAANAVAALYAEAGYSAPESEEGATEAVRAAQESVRAAEQGLLTAQNELATTPVGATLIEVREADNTVASARRELAAAQDADPQDPLQLGNLVDALELAELRRQQLGSDRTDAPQRAAVDVAATQLTQAQEELTRTEQAALPALPAGEVLYLSELPRRVDAVTAQRGSLLEGPAMTVSGATLGLSGSAAEADARLLKVDDKATFELPDGTVHQATIKAVAAGEGESPRWTIELQPDPLTPEQIQELQGSNVRVSIAVGATDGDVLSVPYAALSAGPGGETRVEVTEGDPRDGEETTTRLVVVRSGLATSGAVEVTPIEGDLTEGDLVVVGK